MKLAWWIASWNHRAMICSRSDSQRQKSFLLPMPQESGDVGHPGKNCGFNYHGQKNGHQCQSQQKS